MAIEVFLPVKGFGTLVPHAWKVTTGIRGMCLLVSATDSSAYRFDLAGNSLFIPEIALPTESPITVRTLERAGIRPHTSDTAVLC